MKFHIQNHPGFTLIELLVVIAIIGLLANMAMVGINNARKKSRDATRVANIKTIRDGLEMYFSDNGSYPANPTGTNNLGETGATTLSAGAGWADSTSGSIFIGKVPDDPKDYNYIYHQVNSGSSYVIDFGLEAGTGDLSCSTYSATCCSTSPTSTSCN